MEISPLESAIERHLIETFPRGDNKWGERHVKAWQQPRGMETPVVHLIEALEGYAQGHFKLYGSRIGDDGVLGEEWLAIAKAIRGLCNGELGRLDGGTIFDLLSTLVREAGFATEEWE